MKTCNQLMTENPKCCLPSDMVEKAAQLMRAENVGSVPIIQDQQSKRLIGIVTDRDLALKVVAEGRDSKSTKLETVMTRNPVTCRPDDNIEKALAAMTEHQLRRIPIVAEGHQVLGIIAQADVATQLQKPSKTAEVVQEISKPAAASQ